MTTVLKIDENPSVGAKIHKMESIPGMFEKDLLTESHDSESLSPCIENSPEPGGKNSSDNGKEEISVPHEDGDPSGYSDVLDISQFLTINMAEGDSSSLRLSESDILDKHIEESSVDSTMMNGVVCETTVTPIFPRNMSILKNIFELNPLKDTPGLAPNLNMFKGKIEFFN